MQRFVSGMRSSGRWTEKSLDFMDKVVHISGVGPKTYFPEGAKAIFDLQQASLAAQTTPSELRMCTMQCCKRCITL